IQRQIPQRALGAEEGGVVQPHANIRLDLSVRQEVPLQAKRRRQVFGGTDITQALGTDVMLERKRTQQLYADIAGCHISKANAGSRAAADVQTDITKYVTIIGFGLDVRDTRLQQPVACLMRSRWRSG